MVFFRYRRHRSGRTSSIGAIFHSAVTVSIPLLLSSPVAVLVTACGTIISQHVATATTTTTAAPNTLTFVIRPTKTTSRPYRSSKIYTHTKFSTLSTAITKRSLNTQNSFGSERRIRSRQQQHRPYNCNTYRNMALIPLDVSTLERIISSSGKPTGAQYATYWGRTMKERYGLTIESATVGFLGVFFSYFLSFIVGGFIATILGSLFFFWGILSPELKAYQRNWEFLGGRPLVDFDVVQARRLNPEQAGLYGGLFVGHIEDVCVVEDTNDSEVDEYDLKGFSDYTMETDELDRYSGQPYLLRIRCTDQLGRTLQVHTRLSEDYLDLQPGMPSAMLLLSTSPTFSKLAALTDIFVLMSGDDNDVIEGCWIGDYPYLDRIEFEALLAEDDELWDALLDESSPLDDESSFRKSDINSDTDNNEKWNKVLIPAKGRRKR